MFREPFMVQQYRPEVRAGDKRIILVDGEVAGAINRVPAADETRSNLHVGGSAKPTELTPRDREICARLGPELKKRGLLFTGIDVIGPYLTEINVTSPDRHPPGEGVRRRRHRGADLGCHRAQATAVAPIGRYTAVPRCTVCTGRASTSSAERSSTTAPVSAMKLSGLTATVRSPSPSRNAVVTLISLI